MNEEATELEWLRYFYDNVEPALGPASDDIIQMIADSFTQETGKALPESFDRDEESGRVAEAALQEIAADSCQDNFSGAERECRFEYDDRSLWCPPCKARAALKKERET